MGDMPLIEVTQSRQGRDGNTEPLSTQCLGNLYLQVGEMLGPEWTVVIHWNSNGNPETQVFWHLGIKGNYKRAPIRSQIEVLTREYMTRICAPVEHPL